MRAPANQIANAHQLESAIRDPDWFAALELDDVLGLAAEALEACGFDPQTIRGLCKDAEAFVLSLGPPAPEGG